MNNSFNRERGLSTAIMLLVVFLAMQARVVLPDLDKSPVIQAIVIVSSKGVYELLIRGIYWLIDNSEFLMRVYLGHLYLRGLWSYEYTIDGRVFFGVWEFLQTAGSCQVVGNGLDADFRVRTIVRSVSPLIEEQGAYFVLNARNELTNGNARVFSKTTLLLDHPRRAWGLVRSMRATTEVFGGPSDRQLHPNVVFTRHPKAQSIEDVAAYLRGRYGVEGDAGGPLPSGAAPPAGVSEAGSPDSTDPAGAAGVVADPVAIPDVPLGSAGSGTDGSSRELEGDGRLPE